MLVDGNVLAEGHDYFELGALDVSPSHRLLAYSTDVTGAEVFTMRIRDLDTGEDLPDVIEGVHYGTAWSADDGHLFYTRPDDAWRSYQIWRHEVGEPADSDVLVYQEDDTHFDVGVENTRSGRFVIISSDSRTTSEVRLLDATDPLAPARIVEPREQGHEYTVDHQGDRLLIVTNLDALDFRLVEAPIDASGRSSWKEVLPHRPGVRLFGVDAFADHLVAFEWADALPTLRVIRSDGSQFVIDQPETAFGLSAGTNLEYETSTYRFNYQSLITPPSVFEVDLATGDRTLLKQQPVLGGFDASAYETVRMWATASDGTKVPISLVARKGLPRDRSNPAVLYGYGSYEVIVAPWFSWPRISLLDRGVVFALAHVRGGGELGRRWYLDGKLLNKRNTFTDFVACAEHLVAEGWTSPDRLAIRGWQRRRAACGRGREHAPRPVRVGRRGGAVRRRRHHDARRDDAADCGRVGGMGQPRRGRVRGIHGLVRPVRERGRRRPARDVRDGRLQRPAGELPRAREVGGATTGDGDRRTAAGPEDRDGRGPRGEVGAV